MGLSKAELALPGLGTLNTWDTLEWVERVLVELSWEFWHYTNLPNVVLNTWCLVKQSSHSDVCPVVLQRVHQGTIVSFPPWLC